VTDLVVPELPTDDRLRQLNAADLRSSRRGIASERGRPDDSEEPHADKSVESHAGHFITSAAEWVRS
jgi:hypothetical protein